MLSAALVVARWQLALPGTHTLSLSDPDAGASHFYGIETGESVRFRWSRDLSAVSLPALASRQQVSVEINPARPGPTAPVRFKLLSGTTSLGTFEARPGWNTYSATAGVGLAPDLRLLIESDTFYPSASDRRRLGLAVSAVSVSPVPGPLGLTWPPYLWLLIAGLAPLLGWAATRAAGRPGALTAGIAASTALTVALSLLPSTVALPIAAWLVGLSIAGLLVYYSRRVLEPGAAVSVLLERIGSSRWELPGVAVLTGAIAVMMTWPLASRLGTALPGWPGDNFAFLYKFWWLRTAILEQHRWPFFDPNTFAPFGFDLGQGEPTLANTLPGVLIGSLSNDVVAYNLVALASFVVSGLGGYLLVREVTGSRLAGLLGCIAFAFCAYRMSQLAGHIQMLGTGWIALSFYFTERALRGVRGEGLGVGVGVGVGVAVAVGVRAVREPPLRRQSLTPARHGVFAGLSLGLAALSAWYYAYMAGLMLALYVSARLWALRRGMPWRRLVAPAIAGAVTFLVLAGPVAVPSLLLWARGDLTHTPKAANEHSASPLDFVIPNALHPLWGEPFMRVHSQQNVIEDLLYLGLPAIAIAAAGFLMARRRGPSPAGGAGPAWLLVLVVSLVLSLGLTLHGLGGEEALAGVGGDGGTGPIPLPGRLLYDWLPLSSSMRAYARFGLVAMLALTVLMGVAWSRLIAFGGSFSAWPRRSAWATLLAAACLLADLWAAPYAWGTSRVEQTAADGYLASAPPGAIMRMPLDSALSGPALYPEVYYRKPITYGYDAFEPAAWRAARPALLDFPADNSLDLLASWGVKYIVVSAKGYGAEWPGTLAFLNSLPRLHHLATFPEDRTWDVDPAVLDARPDLEDALAPDTLVIFQLVR